MWRGYQEAIQTDRMHIFPQIQYTEIKKTSEQRVGGGFRDSSLLKSGGGKRWQSVAQVAEVQRKDGASSKCSDYN